MNSQIEINYLENLIEMIQKDIRAFRSNPQMVIQLENQVRINRNIIRKLKKIKSVEKA